MAIRTLSGLIRTYGTERPDATALDYEGRTITYRELDERSNRVANALVASGVTAGDRVGILAKNCPEFFELLFGAAKTGAVAVAVNWRLAPRETAEILEDSGAGLLILGPEFEEHRPAIEAAAPGLKQVLRLAAGDESFADWVDAADTVDPGLQAGPDDVALQLYTSGTTGLPKGVLVTNHNLFSTLDDLAASWRLDADSRALCAMPLFHIGGVGWALVAMQVGATVVLLPEVDPARMLELLPTCSNAFMVPAVIQLLCTVPGVDDTDFGTLHTVLYGASPIAPTVLRRAIDVFGCDFIQLYGMSEAAGAIVELSPSDHDPENRPELLTSCGRPFPWVTVRVVDPATGKDVPQGEVGEFWVRSPQVTPGYWNKPEESAAALTADGWLRSGDAGYRDADGYLYLHDRIKDMIVSGGENIYPVEIERVLAAHPAVADVAVVGVPHERWGESPKAVIVPNPGASATSEEIIEFCRGKLARFKCPTSVDFVDELPRNPTGKLLKKELRAQYWTDASRRIG